MSVVTSDGTRGRPSLGPPGELASIRNWSLGASTHDAKRRRSRSKKRASSWGSSCHLDSHRRKNARSRFQNRVCRTAWRQEGAGGGCCHRSLLRRQGARWESQERVQRSYPPQHARPLLDVAHLKYLSTVRSACRVAPLPHAQRRTPKD